MPVRSRLVARFDAPASPGGRTARVEVTSSTPLELRGPFAQPCTGSPSSYLLRNVTAGVLDGDDYTIDVCVAAGARVAIGPTSATKVFRTTNQPSTVRTHLEVMPGAELHYAAGVVIPHAGAALRQITEVVLHEGARFSWSDVLSFGRISAGERFQFTRIETEFRILDGTGRTRFERRSVLAPDEDRSALEAAVGGFSAAGSVIRCGFDRPMNLADEVRSGTYAGISSLPNDLGEIVSVLGEWPEQVETVMATVSDVRA